MERKSDAWVTMLRAAQTLSVEENKVVYIKIDDGTEWTIAPPKLNDETSGGSSKNETHT
jgi:hypothetical protein